MLGGFAERFGLSKEHAARVACAFGGGVARTGRTCGAVNGAVMVLGLAHGSSAAGDQPARERSYAATRELWTQFERRCGSTVCRELLGVDIGTPAGHDAAARDGLFRTRCPAFVRAAAEIAARLA